ncbi:MAG: hypothetical protein K8U57_12665 [Planctomycetes bacterium]|nr:hypothetical protein [Planctomycetota bacterium]
MTTLADCLSLREQKEHDAELLVRIRANATPPTLAALFDGMEPLWAREAAERLQIAGKIREVEGERLVAVAKR